MCTELSNQIANLSDTKFKILVIRVLTELAEYGHKIEEEVKTMKSEIKENIQGTNSDRKETRTHINSLDHKEEINSQPEQNEEQELKKKKKMRRALGTSGTTLNIPTSES